MYPRKYSHGPCTRSAYNLAAANGTIIHTYGPKILTLNLGLRHPFTWRFITADVAKPIIEADFLSYFDLKVDLRNRRLKEQLTGLTVAGRCINHREPIVKTVTRDTIYYKLLSEFPDIVRTDERPREIKHQIRQYIKTTPGPPVNCKPRILAPIKPIFIIF